MTSPSPISSAGEHARRFRVRASSFARWLSRAGKLASFSLALGFACRTETPDEVHYDGTRRGGPGAGGGAGRTSETGGIPSVPGQTGGVAGGAVAEGGAGGDSASSGAAGAPTEPKPADDCGPAPVDRSPFTLEALSSSAVDCAIWQFCKFESAAGALEQKLDEHTAGPSERTLSAAQSAFKLAMERWSRIELFQFGPLASSSESAGRDVYLGQGLRDPIYGWPSVARCRVEEQLASQKFLGGTDTVLISARGLYALEYLLFYPGADTACPASSTTAASWSALSGDELSARKLAYAGALAGDVVERARSLGAAYRSGEGDFKSVFVNASGYPSRQEALNVLAWSLYYIEREVKEWKLGVPAGYTLTSPVVEPESPYAGMGTDLLRGNLLGFRGLFQGCGPEGEGLGFDDWLTEAGHAELSNDMLAAYRDALAAVEAFPAFPSASKAQIEGLYAAIKRLTDLLKTEFFGDGSPLGLKLPKGMEGDTD